VRFSAIPVTVLICDYVQRCYRLQNCDDHFVWLRRIKRNVEYSGLHFTCEYITQNRKRINFSAIFELFTAANIKTVAGRLRSDAMYSGREMPTFRRDYIPKDSVF